MVNPGGPGVAGASYAQYGGYFLGNAAAHFDVVGFDPRGVGQSSPIECLSDSLTDAYINADASPDNAAEMSAYIAVSKQFADACVRKAPGLYEHIGTYDTARDLDVLRSALDQSRLTYVGFSYGTRIGAVYADLFPSKVGRLILDGAIDPSNDGLQLVRGQARGFDDALSRFVADAVRNGTPLGSTRAQVTRRINTLLAQADAHPLMSRGRPLTQALAVNAIAGSLYSPSSWPTLESVLISALGGDAAPMLGVADNFIGRDSRGRYASNMVDALNAISCWDSSPLPTAATIWRTARAQAATSNFPELTLQLIMSAVVCHEWRGHATESPSSVRGPVDRPILVIGTTHDPATPLVWARALAEQLRTGVLLTYRGDGHTASGAGSRCVRAVETAYLLTGAAPPDGKVCS